MTDEVRIHRQWRWWSAPETGRRIPQEDFEALPLHGRAALAEAIHRWTKGQSLPKADKDLAIRRMKQWKVVGR